MTYYLEQEDGEIAEFAAPDGTQIQWCVDLVDAFNNLDTENANYAQEIVINGFDGILVEKDGISTIVWGNPITQTMYRIIGDMPKEDLLALAERLTE